MNCKKDNITFKNNRIIAEYTKLQQWNDELSETENIIALLAHIDAQTTFIMNYLQKKLGISFDINDHCNNSNNQC